MSDSAPNSNAARAPDAPPVEPCASHDSDDFPGSNVTVLKQGDRRFYVIGTAHISENSVHEVRQLIDAVRPDSVCVELCQTRYDALTDVDRWKKLDIFQVIRQRKVLFLLANLALSSYQRRLGEQLGVKPGAEMMAAIAKADEQGAELVLADRDIQATLKRTWGNLSFVAKFRTLGALMTAFFSSEEISAADVDHLKERDNVSEVMAEFAKTLPQIQEPLIDERDRYLVSSMEAAPGQSVVSVVGAGHVPGMCRYFGQSVDREALARLPEPKRFWSLLKWVIPALMLCAFYFGYRNHAGEGLTQMLEAWILPNSIFAGLFTLLALAKPLSIVTAVVASPITSMNPTIGAGMVVGLLEAWLRKPTVADCERINDDVQTVRGIYRNPFTRVLLVAAMATLGSAAGAWIGAGWVLALLGAQ